MKKPFLIKFFKIAIICVFISLTSCEKDIYENTLQEKNNIKRVNLSELPFLEKEINKEKKSSSTSKGNLFFYLDKINPENIIEILDQEGIKNYTFALNYREQDTLINLCAKETEEGYKFSLMKYTTTDLNQWIEDIKLTNQSLISPDVKAEYLDDKMAWVPCIKLVFECPSGLHDSDHITQCDYDITEWSLVYEIGHCYQETGGGGGDSNNGVNWSPNTNSGGSGGGNPTILTAPNVTDSPILSSNYLANLNLSPNQNTWLNTNFAVKTTILSYLTNHHTPDDYAFAQQFVAQSYLNSNLNFDFNASLKSPANIDLTKVTATDPNDPLYEKKKKFMCVYDKLLKSPKFRQLFVATFQDNTRPNVSFEVTNLPGNQDAGLVGMTITSNIDSYNNTIQIDTDLLTSGSNMLIANTILHECIHAFLNVKLADPSIGISIPNLNNMDVQDCINSYYNGFNNDQNQHDFMYNYMIPTMTTILSEIKDLLVDSPNNSQMQLLQIDNSTGSTPWNWYHYYNNQAMDGLEQCQFFISEIATIGSNGLPTNIVNFNKWQVYNEYKVKSRDNLNNNCND